MNGKYRALLTHLLPLLKVFRESIKDIIYIASIDWTGHVIGR